MNWCQQLFASHREGEREGQFHLSPSLSEVVSQFIKLLFLLQSEKKNQVNYQVADNKICSWCENEIKILLCTGFC